jgi:D-alanyl-D-alanine carboxypeptidase/D-alanyl-D-alanine-endopeptidase (penicillin-binding protein 4)
MKHWLAALALIAAPLHAAPATLQQQVEARLAEMGPGTRFGLVVADADGREIVAIGPTDRFIPASNTKMFTVAAAFATLPDLDKPDITGGTAVYLSGRDVTLVGRGDARMSSAPDCATDCLSTLADAVAAKTRTVRDITGDATIWADRRWSYGMSWNNFAEQSGTGIAALSLDNNQVPLIVGHDKEGGPLFATSNYFKVLPALSSTEADSSDIDVERLPFDRTVRVTGKLAATGTDATVRLGIDDPAHFTAWTFANMLRARGVRVAGTIRSAYAQSPMMVKRAAPLAQITPPPLLDDLTIINKVSQNQHAELMLRRIGAAGGDASVTGGLTAIETMLTRAGVPRTGYDFADGSGMSTYNRVAPRAMIAFLRWTATQPWGAKFRATLPVGGVDGTIARRFTGTPLAGKVFAKTGGLNATNALSGWMTTANGRELTFALFANDVPQGQRAIPTMDAVLNLIAAAN